MESGTNRGREVGRGAQLLISAGSRGRWPRRWLRRRSAWRRSPGWADWCGGSWPSVTPVLNDILAHDCRRWCPGCTHTPARWTSRRIVALHPGAVRPQREDGRHARHHAASTPTEHVSAAGGGARHQSVDLAAAARPRRYDDRRPAAVLQIAFGWSAEHLHRFVIYGCEFGIGYLGGVGFVMIRGSGPPRSCPTCRRVSPGWSPTG